jgi:hypothetical protein
VRDRAAVGSVASVDVARQRVVGSEGAVVGSVASVDVARQRVVCSEGQSSCRLSGLGGRGEAARVVCRLSGLGGCGEAARGG